MNIWLDDQRKAPEGWILVRNIDEVEFLLNNALSVKDFQINTMSFDFHLSHLKNGKDVLVFMADFCVRYNTKRFWPKEILFHSNDPDGVKVMEEYLKEAEKKLPTA